MMFRAIVNLTAFRNAITRPVASFIRNVIFDLHGKIVALVAATKSGRRYKRPAPFGGTYIASAPGEPPALRTGALLQSIRDTFPSPFTGQMEINAPYARLLEEGTARMRPRPFVRPALVSVTERFNRGVRGQFQ